MNAYKLFVTALVLFPISYVLGLIGFIYPALRVVSWITSVVFPFFGYGNVSHNT